MTDLKFIKSKVEDHKLLTDLTLKSKAYWGYTEQQIESWREMLTISEEYIVTHPTYLAVESNKIIGYYSWIQKSPSSVELDNMFLNTKFIGKGYGSLLMKDFLEQMVSKGVDEILLYSDPNAESFYRKFGFEVVGQSESNIKGRFLPIMRKDLKSKNQTGH